MLREGEKNVNPLDFPGKPFEIELWNPNPTSRKTKDGPVYRISFEIDREPWDCFMAAELKGMIIIAQAMVYEGSEPLPEKTVEETKGEYGEYAKQLEIAGFFHAPKLWPHVGKDAEFLDWVRSKPCSVCGAVPPSEAAHVRRVSSGAGTGIKPEYSAIPLCHTCHARQHNEGESAIGGKEKNDQRRSRCVREWARTKLKADLGFKSWTEVPPKVLADWCEKRDLFYLLPKCYKELK